jgi:predicted Abi (CAAX) family protease
MTISEISKAQIGQPRTSVGSHCWRPTSAWSGRLVLPTEQERKDDGGVYIQLSNVPDDRRELLGKKVWLKLAPSTWSRQATQDIHFTKATLENQDKGNLAPERLNGWKAVSPLESLAGARKKNDMTVALEQVHLVGDPPTLEIEDEPIQISGSQKALVQFEKKLPGGRWLVRHWNPSKSDFSGPREVVENAGSDKANPLQDAQMNREGYYLYAEPSASGVMQLKALEPRALLSLEADQVMLGQRRSLDYLKKENWRVEQLRGGETTKTLLDPTVDPKARPIDIHRSVAQQFQEGEEYLVVHNFGGRSNDQTPFFGLATGHFALGTAEVVKDEFTGENRLDVEYRQVYANNPEGIVSGAMKWHNYMADLSGDRDNGPRGWMYHRPVSDVLIRVPELQKTSTGYQPMEVLKDRLSEMTSRYRTGEGDGSAIVGPAQSCSADSAQALYATTQDWRSAVGRGEAGEELLAFSELVASQVTPVFGLAPRAWRKTARNESKPDPNRMRVLPALLSPKTILPRDHADGLVEKTLRAGHPSLIIKTDIIAADIDYHPVAPSKAF